MTFIAEGGVEAESTQIGPDYTDYDLFEAAVRAEHSKQWDDGASAGYEAKIAQNMRKLSRWRGACTWVSWLSVPYGYLVLTR